MSGCLHKGLKLRQGKQRGRIALVICNRRKCDKNVIDLTFLVKFKADGDMFIFQVYVLK